VLYILSAIASKRSQEAEIINFLAVAFEVVRALNSLYQSAFTLNLGNYQNGWAEFSAIEKNGDRIHSL